MNNILRFEIPSQRPPTPATITPPPARRLPLPFLTVPAPSPSFPVTVKPLDSSGHEPGKPGPIHARWHALKSQLPPGTLLFLRLGAFLETFEDDAKLVAPLLNIALTKRNTIPMAGIPFHARDTYLHKLVAAGHAIATAEGADSSPALHSIIVPPSPVDTPELPEWAQAIYARMKPTPASNAPDEPVAGILHIHLHRAEGFAEECVPRNYDSFELAQECMVCWGETAPDKSRGGYDKTDVCVTFPDGKQWGYRYDLTHGGSDSNDGMSFRDNLKQRLSFYAGRWTPEWMIKENHPNRYIKEPEADAVAILDTWFAGEATPDPLPAKAADPNAKLTTAEVDRATNQGIRIVPPDNPLSAKQAEFLAMSDALQLGAILASSWGYEQTNVSYYRITKRSKSFVELEQLESAIRETHFMSGWSVPLDEVKQYQGEPVNLRRKITSRDGRAFVKIESYASASLWDGTPQTCSWYA